MGAPPLKALGMPALLNSQRWNLLEERAVGDARSHTRRKVTKSRSTHSYSTAHSLSASGSTSDLWRRTDYLVSDGGNPMRYMASALTSIVGGTGLQRATASHPAHFTLLARTAVGEPVDTGGTPWVVTVSYTHLTLPTKA